MPLAPAILNNLSVTTGPSGTRQESGLASNLQGGGLSSNRQGGGIVQTGEQS